MAAFKRLTHDSHIARAVEGIISATIGQIDEIGHKISAHFSWIDEMRHAEFFGHGFLARIDVNADDLLCADHAQALNDI